MLNDAGGAHHFKPGADCAKRAQDTAAPGAPGAGPCECSSLEATHPELGRETQGTLDMDLPSTVSAGSGRKFCWSCRVCGRNWVLEVGNRVLEDSAVLCLRRGQVRGRTT